MNNERTSRKEKNQNIQVFVRLRPINNREREIKSLGVVEVSGTREVIVRQSPLQSNHTKKFTFDRAFGPNSKQVDVYHEVVSPLIEEVLSGYNCTVFAYGQTGTGKTHTMVGESSNDELSWQNDPMAGIIPRSLSQLFDELRLTNSEYTVRVSYLELYNEELFDLLSTSEDNSKLRIYEDVTRKGSNIVNGLEEITVYNKNEVYKIMEQGQERKRVATTLMNAQSSRSHTVFTIVVHIKETSPEGEELMKIGKLNLVDLAGSENISKAGSDNPQKRERARECVNINQSLLTLGRVITSLVERHPHIPYRESKLTRLLQESLGGRTKTSIIATISPGHKDLEETLSTLEYAYRAKNIQNKPEINQKMTKKAVLKEFSEEIDRLKRDLQASREKNGVYLANETYTDIQLKIQDQEKDLQDKILAIKAMKEEKDKMEAIYNKLSDNLRQKEVQLDVTNQDLSNTKIKLATTINVLSSTKELVEEKELLLSIHSKTEEKLGNQAKSLLGVADTVVEHVDCLLTTVNKHRNLEETNDKTTQKFSEKSRVLRTNIRDYLRHATDTLVSELITLQESFDNDQEKYVQQETENKDTIDCLVDKMDQTLKEVQLIRQLNEQSALNDVSKKSAEVREKITHHASQLEDRQRALLCNAVTQISKARNKNQQLVQHMHQFICQWQDSNADKVDKLCLLLDSCLAEAQELVSQATRRHQASVARQTEEYTRAKNFYQEQKQRMDEDISQLTKTFENEINRLRTRKDVSYDIIMESSQNELVKLGDEDVLLEGLLTEAEERLCGMGEETSASVREIKVSDKQFCEAVDERIKQISTETCECLDVTQGKLEAEIETAVSDSKLLATESIGITEQFMSNIMESQKDTLDNFFQNLQNFKQQHQHALDSVSKNMSCLISAQNSHRQTTDLALARARDATIEVRENISGEMASYDQMENEYLQEYKTYSPTGKTPVRQEYRYPRLLAATSPHDRILQRFRTNRLALKLEPEDTVELLDDTLESPGSNSGVGAPVDSSGDLDNSACVFLEPRLPNTQTHTPKQTHICKSTSESDIFTLMQNKTGKENLNRSVTGLDKKEFTSKLRPPTSHKKALGDRN